MDLYRRGRVLGIFAELSYKDGGEGHELNEEEVRTKALALGFDQCEFYKHGNAQGWRFESPRDIVIALRGTETDCMEDIKADLRIAREGTEYGLVHRGFLIEVNDLWPQVKADVAVRGDTASKGLYFTGHSLGGAMATVMANECYNDPTTLLPVELHTFGSPRTGDLEWIENIAVTHHRWQNNNDIVPRMPPNICNRYMHHGVQHYMDSDGYSFFPTRSISIQHHCQIIIDFIL